MAPQPIEKTEYALGNGMGLEASNLLDLVHGAAGPLDPQKRWGRLNRMFPRFEFDFSAFLIVDQGVVGFFGRKM